MNAAIILAGGGSSRLGQPKQLLSYSGKTLLQHAIDEALEAGAHPLIVVLGAAFDEIYATVKDEPVQVVENDAWQSGIGSSIHAGIKELLAIAPDVAAVWFLLSDQPYVTSTLLTNMRQLAENSSKGIVACAYTDTIGVPTLIQRKYLDELLMLPKTAGAKVLLTRHPEDVASLQFPGGAIDIDTSEDYAKLR